jgi:hypothetical protein
VGEKAKKSFRKEMSLEENLEIKAGQDGNFQQKLEE